jgi:pimeloyl-ACP methyl ester carboxylesterase
VTAASDIGYGQADLRVGGVGLKVAVAGRDGGPAAPLVFLHGFGSTKEDYADVACQRAFTGRPFLAYDAPGCGQTCCADLAGISIPFLVKTARAVLDHAGIRRFHLVGHSMGGLTALLLAHQEPDRVLSLVDIEGNLAPEDCFLSRQIRTHPADNDDDFFDGFAERARRSPSPSSALFAASLRHKVRPGAVRGIFESMVDLSDHGDLMPKFLALPCPRMFMYGEENSAVSYLADLAAGGVELAEIPHSGHWPMYANPVAMWERIAAFIGQGSVLPCSPRIRPRAGAGAVSAEVRPPPRSPRP